ncbi:MAG: TspO/MBR family protein [Pseudomonadota bacterium]
MDWTLFILFLGSCFAAGATGALFPPGTWYEALKKPVWTPPNWLFPVAWTTLYLLISFAAARAAPNDGSAYAMAFYAIQIALNALWTPVFFGLRRMDQAMIVVLALWLAVAATMVAFYRLDMVAGLLFAPYLLWVTVAAALNLSVWRKNKDAVPA